MIHPQLSIRDSDIKPWVCMRHNYADPPTVVNTFLTRVVESHLARSKSETTPPTNIKIVSKMYGIIKNTPDITIPYKGEHGTHATTTTQFHL